MSALSDTLSSDIQKIFSKPWDSRNGSVVPETKDVALANGAVKLDAAVLYADLARSTQLAQKDKRVAAKVVRAYLSTMARLITKSGGVVRSFDGDRVMGVFIGGSKNSNAARCALKMNWVLIEMLRPQAKTKFSSLKGAALKHCVGVSRSEVMVVRGGIRDNNDLVFVGAAPNLAAKLSEIRNAPWNIYITGTVYNSLNKDAKFSRTGENMWSLTSRTVAGTERRLYKSSWRRQP